MQTIATPNAPAWAPATAINGIDSASDPSTSGVIAWCSLWRRAALPRPR